MLCTLAGQHSGVGPDVSKGELAPPRLKHLGEQALAGSGGIGASKLVKDIRAGELTLPPAHGSLGWLATAVLESSPWQCG